MTIALNDKWPVLKRFDRQHLRKLALPLGGIGTGTVSLGGRGNLHDWEIVNRPAKGFNGSMAFFALYAKAGKNAAVTRALEGLIPQEDYEGASSGTVTNHNLPRFRTCSFAAAYPMGQVLLADPDVPVTVRLEAFNPLVPPDADRSGIPVAVLRYVLQNTTGQTVKASVCGSLRNFIGTDGSSGEVKANVNEFRSGKQVKGLFMKSNGVPKRAEQWGTLALAVTAKAGVTARTAWKNFGWAVHLLDFWDDFSADGQVEEREIEGENSPFGSLAASVTIPPRGTRAVTFLLTWHFPNRQAWFQRKPEDGAACGCDPNWVGNYYATQYADAWDVAERTAAELRQLEAETVKFVGGFCDSDLPAAVKDAALSNVCNLRTQTCFRIEDGRFFAWEGCGDKCGCCDGTCTHVWNYESATAFLFGGIARSMRDTEFRLAMHDNGLMSFRVHLPLPFANEAKTAAADGQMGCLIKLYRDWQLSGDEAMLQKLWPGARKALEFCWLPGGWDGDQDGVMEGCQHNTMDVEYFGPNGQMCTWYLGALRAGEEMARHVGDDAFADLCRSLFERGRAWVDANLFNGEYYEHQVWPMKPDAIVEGCRIGIGAKDPSNPEWQLGKACLVDQLVGQYLAHTAGLGHLLNPQHVRTTLRSIMKHNFRQLYGHFNNMRTFALNEERALLMATYPRGERPKMPFPYFTEVMTGFEYSAAVGMLYEGLTADGLKVIGAIRDRYDGRKRSPWNEAECGHHYGRAMASWGAVLATTGFRYSAVDGRMTFAPRNGTWFWSNGSAWGSCRLKAAGKKTAVELMVGAGSLKLRRFSLTDKGEQVFTSARVIAAGRSLRFTVQEVERKKKS